MSSLPTIKIGFLGTPRFAERVLKTLSNSPFRPVFVITETDKPVGRQRQLTASPVKDFARLVGLPVYSPTTHQALQRCVETLQPDLLIVAAYGRILKPSVFSLPRYGTLNIHASLLPKYRGASPIQAAILAGDHTTGVSLMQIDEGLDTGPVIAQAELVLEANETTPRLSERLAKLGADLLIQKLPQYLDGSLVPVPQPSGHSVTKLLTKQDGKLTVNQSPVVIERMLRAFTPWPGVWFEINGQRLLLHQIHLENGKLMLDRIQLAGKQPVAWETFRRDRADLAVKIVSFLEAAPDS